MRTPSGASEEKYLMIAIKYNDLQNKGKATQDDFVRILTKYGVHHLKEEDLKKIFAHYDGVDQGYFYYKEFVSELFGHAVTDSKSTTVASSMHNGLTFQPKETEKADFAELDKIIDLILYILTKRGMHGVLEFWATCKNYDKSCEDLLDSRSFSQVFADLRLDLNQNEIAKVFRTYETRNNFELMNYQMLIKDLCINLNTFRKDLVRTMFERFDSNENGKVNMNVISELFNAKNHYDVKSGRKTPDEIDRDFQNCIRLFRELKENVDMVRSDHFIQLFQCISTSIESDYQFETLVNNCFRYNEIARAISVHNMSTAQSVTTTPIYDKERQHPSESMKYT